MVVEPGPVEVVLSAIDREVAPPVARVAAVDDGPPRVDALDPTGAAPERERQGRLLERGRLEVRLRQDRHRAHDHRQLAVPRPAVEDEPDRTRAGPFDAPDLTVVEPMVGPAPLLRRPRAARETTQGEAVEPMVGPAPLLRRLPGEDDVVDGDRAPVVEARLRPQHEGDGGTVVRHFDRLGDEAVEGERLVPCPAHQRLEHEMPPVRRRPLDDERIEVVEGAGQGAPQPPAPGNVRAHVVEVLEAGPVLEGAVHRDTVAAGGRRRCAAREQKPEPEERGRRETPPDPPGSAAGPHPAVGQSGA